MDSQNNTFLTVMILNILVSGVFIVVAIYFILILRDIKGLSKKAKDEGEKILDDVDEARQNVKQGGQNIKKTIRKFFGIKSDK